MDKVYSWHLIGYDAIDDGREVGAVEFRLLSPTRSDAIRFSKEIVKKNHHRIVTVTELDVERIAVWTVEFGEGNAVEEAENILKRTTE